MFYNLLPTSDIFEHKLSLRGNCMSHKEFDDILNLKFLPLFPGFCNFSLATT
jgi:hypothetical protein